MIDRRTLPSADQERLANILAQSPETCSQDELNHLAARRDYLLPEELERFGLADGKAPKAKTAAKGKGKGKKAAETDEEETDEDEE